MRALMIVVLLLLPALAFAAEERYPFDDPAKRVLFVELTEELRCPKCQNQNIADSNAMVAEDLKRKVYQLVQEGQSKSEVVDYMKLRYGDFVYYQPPLNLITLSLWLLPLAFVLLAVVVLVKKRKRSKETNAHDLLAEAEEWLEKDK
ncbi:cytochrome c-type biogenesis protein CcmH [Aliiglaciecola sp. CAU 1673]|uniref:cytochrome c-type biogenesis protein n=1 Tax=Aliiglaciecola sp. CAU 1673 TaxID=3032595 RepID=UPI0023DBC83A|nr:cytochrome c-type biogenesis protein [Aliiglaciecola sp. CAU 1673]MDF2177492.1 cytochrome c-type biogenesis protein CcmH [Aliiglaciecola sp. CAU 1673]